MRLFASHAASSSVVSTVALGLALALAACRSAPPVEPARAPFLFGDLPVGFPPPVDLSDVDAEFPAASAELVELGRHLFYDERLSGEGHTSCGFCHRQELAFTDGRARAIGGTGQFHPRSTMSLTNVAYNTSFGWANPELTTLEAQALVPMLNEHPVEMGVAGREEEVLDRFRQDPQSLERFRKAFPGDESPVRLATVARAISAFERTLLSGDSPYDRRVLRNDADALSEAAQRGMTLFFSERLACAACHSGFNFSGPVRTYTKAAPEGTFHNTGLYNLMGKGFYPSTDQGLYRKTGKPRDLGRFKAPTLRNIEVTAPYMHDGSLATLEDVLDHYAAGGRTLPNGPNAGVGSANRHKSELIRGFEISEEERQDLLEFLRSLTDRKFLTNPKFADPEVQLLPVGLPLR